MKLIDTHCHLYVPEFDADREEMLRRAQHAGIDRMMLPNIDEESIMGMLQLADKYPGICFPMMGLHPCSVREGYQEILARMKTKIDQHHFVGIGETGIDLYWDTTTREIQIDAFEQQISWALEYDLPVIIHSRESLDLTISIISNRQNGNLRGIFHCFTGTTAQGRVIAGLNFKMGIGGVLTYKKSDLGEVIKQLPLDALVLETDAPYLPPVPYRGKRNEPSYLPEAVRKMATDLGLSVDEIAGSTARNAIEVFRI